MKVLFTMITMMAACGPALAGCPVGDRYRVNRRRRVARQPLEGWPEKFATMDGNYAQSGAAAQKAMLDDKDEADVTKALKR